MRVLTGLILVLLLADPPTSPSPIASAPAGASSSAQSPCQTLAGVQIGASDIGLPTSAATLTSAVIVPASSERVEGARTVLAIPEYCKVLGVIGPVDPSAPSINFQINL